MYKCTFTKILIHLRILRYLFGSSNSRTRDSTQKPP